jgi:hypothetical protein
METKVNYRSLHYVFQFAITCLLLSTTIWISFQLYPSMQKTWLRLRLITSPCLSSEECAVFNVTCYSNGTNIFYGINNTVHIGKKIFQLETNRINMIHEFIRTHSFKSDLKSSKVLFHIEFLNDNNQQVYFWRNDSITYTILTSLLNIDSLSSYKRWSVLLRTAYMLSNRRQRKQVGYSNTINSEQIGHKFKRSNSLIIPEKLSLYTINDYHQLPEQYITSAVQSIKTIGIVIPNFDDELCFFSQVIISTFDLIDACLSTNDIIGDNQFYPLRDEFLRLSNQNDWSTELSDSQGKFNFKIGCCFVEIY